MAYVSEYQRAAEALRQSHAASIAAHTALFDFAGKLGELVKPLTERENPLALSVRFIRKSPPHLDAPRGVVVEEAAKDQEESFAAVVLGAQDLWLEIRSNPGSAVDAVTNIDELAPFAASVRGVRSDDRSQPHLLQVMPGAGEAVTPMVSEPAALLEMFLVAVGDTFARRAAFNPYPSPVF